MDTEKILSNQVRYNRTEIMKNNTSEPKGRGKRKLQLETITPPISKKRTRFAGSYLEMKKCF